MTSVKKEIDFASIEQMMDANPEDWFPAEERARRFEEMMGRVFAGKPRTFDGHSGQNRNAPFLSNDELKERGYPAPKAPFK